MDLDAGKGLADEAGRGFRPGWGSMTAVVSEAARSASMGRDGTRPAEEDGVDAWPRERFGGDIVAEWVAAATRRGATWTEPALTLQTTTF